jgi:hypothetical protein
MNERIRLLAEQALKSSMVHDGVYRPEGYNNAVSKEFADKFAQLIIEECLRMCDCADVSLLEHNRPQEASGASSVKQFIAEHFGVEE